MLDDNDDWNPPFWDPASGAVGGLIMFLVILICMACLRGLYLLAQYAGWVN